MGDLQPKQNYKIVDLLKQSENVRYKVKVRNFA